MNPVLALGLLAAAGLLATRLPPLPSRPSLHLDLAIAAGVPLVLVGLVLLATLLGASAARPRQVGHTAWEGIAMYWHFVDAVWVVVFSVVYLGTVIG